jgi:hypothetical protein
LSLFGAEIDLQNQELVGVGMGLGGFNGGHSDLNVAKLVYGNHPGAFLFVDVDACVNHDSKCTRAKKEYAFPATEAAPDFTPCNRTGPAVE